MGATLFVQPFDLIKNRMQLLGKSGVKVSFAAVAGQVVKEEGFFKLYNGYVPARMCLSGVSITCSLTAGLLRQATYTTTRMGVYNSLETKFA